MVHIKAFEQTGGVPMDVVNSVHAMRDKWVSKMQKKYNNIPLKVICTSSWYMANDERATYGITVVIDTNG